MPLTPSDQLEYLRKQFAAAHKKHYIAETAKEWEVKAYHTSTPLLVLMLCLQRRSLHASELVLEKVRNFL